MFSTCPTGAPQVARDFGFALAHYKLSVTMHWDDSLGTTAERAHAEAAWRLGA